MKKRHLFFYSFLRPLVAVFLRLKLGYRFAVAKGLPSPYIVLSNHNTDYDPLLVGCSFKKQMYFVTSEHVFRWKTAGRLLRYTFAPIARYKGSTASSTVMEILRTLRAGRNVCMFAEGDRSWDGVTGPILPSTGKMVKSARCALVTYRIEGGYFVSPRWSVTLRRGRLKGEPVRVYTKEELAAMTPEEINAAINADLYENAYARQQAGPAPYRGKALAEKLETVLYDCPRCGKEGALSSQGDELFCACGLRCRYTETGMLEGGPFQTVKEWVDWQRKKLEEQAEQGKACLHGGWAVLSAVEHHEETLVAQGQTRMDTEEFACGERSFPVKDITGLAMHGRNRLVFTVADGGYYELRPRQNSENVYKYQALYQALGHVKTI